MENCSRCEELPDTTFEEGSIYLSPPLGHTFEKVVDAIEEAGLSYDETMDDVLSVDVDQETADTFFDAVTDRLDDAEVNDTKSLYLDNGKSPGIRDLANMKPLSELIGQARADWLADVIRSDKLISHFQPIVDMQSPSDVHGYECLLRAKNDSGGIIPPGRIFEAAERGNMTFLLDRHARITSIQEANKHSVDTKVFVNFIPTSIYDPEYCLRTTVEALEETSLSEDQVNFEVVETEETKDRDKLTDVLNFYRDRGFGIALDDMGSGYNSMTMLKDIRPDYMKLDFELVQGVTEDGYKAEIAESLIEVADQLGITVIAEGIETPADWKWFKERPVDLGQGFYFARPDSPPPEPTTSDS